MERCSHGSCPWLPKFNVEGSKTAAFCKQHAEDGMVNIFDRRCSHDTPACTMMPMYNVEGSNTGVYCKQHARAGMVVVGRTRCLHGPCHIPKRFNFEGKPPVYCKEHADDGMVNLRGGGVRRGGHGKRCSYASCTKYPSFNVEGTKPAVYCKKHAEDGMVDVVIKHCSHDSCTSRASWGRPADGMATVCSGHKNDISGDHVIYFRTACHVDGCTKLSRWGLDGKKPTHCPHHGAHQDGLVCIIKPTRSKRDFRSTSDRAVKIPPFRVKTECSF